MTQASSRKQWEKSARAKSQRSEQNDIISVEISEDKQRHKLKREHEKPTAGGKKIETE